MISRNTIDKIFLTARVEEVISDFVNLKKSGSSYKGLSPFSDERSPSFMVSPAKQIWKDFSSGKGGNVVSFLMEHEHYTYPEALKYLAKKYNIEVEEDELSIDQKKDFTLKESLYKINEVGNDFFQNQLWETEEGKNIGLSYFKERGFTENTIKKFQLGFSPPQRNAWTQYAEAKGYQKEILEASGLTYYKEDNGIDRFRERVMFPILSFSGRVLGFGGRILGTQTKVAKYINSPETEIYHKSQILYGIFQSKQAIIKENNCFLVEGYTDVISMHQNGVENVVASSGTALTVEQIRLIKRLTNDITILFDGDAAGIKASFRSIDMILEQDMNVKVLLFPEGHDPDSFARNHSADDIKSFIAQNATDFIQFKTKILAEEAKDDVVKTAAMLKEIINSIMLISNLIQRELYIKECAKISGISEKVLFNELNRQIQGRERTQVREKKKELIEVKTIDTTSQNLVDPLIFLEEEIIQLMLKYGDLIIQLKDDEGNYYQTTIIEEVISEMERDDISFKSEFYKKVFNEIKEGFKAEELRTGNFFVTYMDEDINQLAVNTLTDELELSENWHKRGVNILPREIKNNRLVYETVLRYKGAVVQDMIDDIRQNLKEEESERIEQLKQILPLLQLKNSINTELTRVL